MTHQPLSRRRLLKRAGTIAAAMSLPAWYVEQSLAQPATAPSTSPNDKPNIALIGCGGRGTADAKAAQKFANIVALCDVDSSHLDKAKQTFAGADGFNDFRKLLARKEIDAVIVGTVDHWHVPVAIAAMRAGKDVYCEKPLGLTISETKHLVQVQKETRRVFQTGTQQRSTARFKMAVDVIRSGRIGKVQRAEVWLPAGLRQGPFQASPVPKEFDYDFWLGSTPGIEYVKERTHKTFRYWWDYSDGTMTDWGAHHNDVVLWCMDLDHTGPTIIEGKQTIEMIPGGYTAASEYEVTYTYGSGLVHTCKSTTASDWDGSVKDRNGQQHGIKFIGTDGWVWVTRANHDASNPDIFGQPLPAAILRADGSSDHMANFIDCLKSRKDPICHAEIGHRSASVCHLGTIAIRLGRKLNWDPQKEEFIGDAEASRHLSREKRKPYDDAFIA